MLTLWSGLGVTKVFQTAMNTVWNVPYKERPNFSRSTLRAVEMLAVLGVITILSTLVAGVGAGSDSLWLAAVGIVVSLALVTLPLGPGAADLPAFCDTVSWASWRGWSFHMRQDEGRRAREHRTPFPQNGPAGREPPPVPPSPLPDPVPGPIPVPPSPLPDPVPGPIPPPQPAPDHEPAPAPQPPTAAVRSSVRPRMGRIH